MSASSDPAATPEPVEQSLRALEPPLPDPPAQLPDELAEALQLADIADGGLPRFLSEQRPVRSPEQEAADARAEQEKRGEAAWEKIERKDGNLTHQEFADFCRTVDPAGRAERPRKRYR